MNTATANTEATSLVSGQAATYQRLRAHLAFLKLPAAAEALPGILDAARAEQLSVTETLERVLAVEVDTTSARRLASRLRFACLPTTASLEQFDFAAQPGADEKLIRELASLRSSMTPATCCSSARPARARRCWRSAWPAPPPRPGTGSLQRHLSSQVDLRLGL